MESTSPEVQHISYELLVTRSFLLDYYIAKPIKLKEKHSALHFRERFKGDCVEIHVTGKINN